MWLKTVMSLGLTALLASPGLQAENIVIPLGDQGQETNPSQPERGMLKPAVRQMLGEPMEERPAVGTPPISVWEYADFNVFFEYEHVLHVVKKHRPEHPEEID